MSQNTALYQLSGKSAGPLPPAPTRDQIIQFRCSLQGIKLTLPDGQPWYWWDCDITNVTGANFRNNRALRQLAYDAKRKAGNTHIAISLEGTYDDKEQALASLEFILPLMREAIAEGFWPALFCKGDGVGDPEHDPDHTDMGSCGYPWLKEQNNFETIVQRVADAGLFPYTVFFPGFDGCNPAWGKNRCIDWLLYARGVLDTIARTLGLPYGYSGFENSGGYWCWTGEHDDYAEPSGQALDVVCTEYNLDYCVPDIPPPPNFMSLPDDERAPWDCVYQIDKRILGPHYNRPADQPPDDDPGTFHGGPMVHSTPRGPFGVSLFEFDTFIWKRRNGGGLTEADVKRHGDAGYTRGYPNVC